MHELTFTLFSFSPRLLQLPLTGDPGQETTISEERPVLLTLNEEGKILTEGYFFDFQT